jgi:multidrug efflux pump subunit AcrB
LRSRDLCPFQRSARRWRERCASKGASDVAVAEKVAAGIEAVKTAHPEVDLKLIDSSVTYTFGNYHEANKLSRRRDPDRDRVFLFLRDWRATIIAAITLPLSILPAFG